MTPKEETGRRGNLLAECVIALSVCFGLHFFVAEPARKRLVDAQAEVDRLSAAQQEVGTLVARMPEVMERLRTTERLAGAMESRGAIVRDEGELFSGVMRLASEAGVRVDVMEPQRTAPRVGRAGQSEQARPGDRALGYTINATGGFHDMCVFLSSLQNDLGHTLVSTVRLTPLHGGSEPGGVSAVLETSHFLFDVSLPTAGELADAAAREDAP